MSLKRKLDNGSGSGEKKGRFDHLAPGRCIMLRQENANGFFAIMGDKYGDKYPAVEVIQNGSKYGVKEGVPEYISIDGDYWPLPLCLDPKTKDKNPAERVWYDETQQGKNPGMVAILMQYQYTIDMSKFVVDEEAMEIETEIEIEEGKEKKKPYVAPVEMKEKTIKNNDIFELQIPGILAGEAKKLGIVPKHIVQACLGSIKCSDEKFMEKLEKEFLTVPDFKETSIFSLDIEKDQWGSPHDFVGDLPEFDIAYYHFDTVTLKGRKHMHGKSPVEPIETFKKAFELKIFGAVAILGVILNNSRNGCPREIPIQHQLWMQLDKLASENGYKVEWIGQPEPYGLNITLFFSKFKVTAI